MSTLEEQAAADVASDKFQDLYRDGQTIQRFVMEQLVHHSFVLAKRNDDVELMEIIKASWLNVNETPYFESTPIPVGLLGGPGQGKTSVMLAAAKDAAAFMGLKLVSSRNAQPTKNDFFFDSVTLGGALSPMGVKGTPLPAKATFTDASGAPVEERVMESVLPTNVTKAKYARVGFILLDDAPNAQPDVLTAIYDLLKPEVDSDFSNIYYSYTGNTGEDGAAAKKFNTAIASRCRLMYMKDLPRDFVSRIDGEYQNDIAYSYINSLVMSFIEKNGALLNTSPLKAQQEKTQFACSRTWTQFTEQLAQVLRPYAYRNQHAPGMISKEDTGLMLNEVHALATDNLGRDVGKKLYQHTLRVLQDAEPIAKAILMTGKIDKPIEERLATKYTNGDAAEEIEFVYSLAVALSNNAAELYSEAFKDNDSAECKRVLDAFCVGMFEAIKGPQASEFAGHNAQSFFNGVISRNKGDSRIGVKQKDGVTLVSHSFFSDVIVAGSKNQYAMATIRNPLGQSVQLIDRIKDNAAIQSMSGTDIANKIDQADAYKKALGANKPVASGAKPAPSSKPTANVPAAAQTSPQTTTTPKPANTTVPVTPQNMPQTAPAQNQNIPGLAF